MKRYLQMFGILISVWLGWMAQGWAEPGDEALLSGTAYLRALSLDVRGHPPTYDEYGQLVDASGVVDAESVLDSWMNGEEEEKFVERVVRFHRQRFWNNNEGTEIGYYLFNLAYDSGADIWYNAYKADDIFGRGSQLVCGDFPATLDASGMPMSISEQWGERDEGWVMVEPYWDPENPVKVCAWDAMESLSSVDGIECNTDEGWGRTDCGCGPNLAFCFYTIFRTEVAMAFDEDINRRVAELVREDRPYTDLLMGNRVWVNGPIVDFVTYKKNIWMYGTDFHNIPYQPERMPDLEWSDSNIWVEVELGAEQAGVFTSPAFLMRFMSNRARANRFFNEFLCQPFQTPEGGLPVGGESAQTLNLNERDGCKYCHALLEPTAATWGRWVQGGVGYMDPEVYPSYNAACLYDTNTRDCRYYVTATTVEEYPYVGYLEVYKFLEERHHPNVDLGPAWLVDQGIQDGRIQRCVAQKAAEHFLGRELEESEDVWLQQLADDFEASGWNYKFLVKGILQSSSYRRIP